MQITKNLGKLAITASKLPAVAAVVYNPTFRSKTQSLPGFKELYGKGWMLPHPFDRRYHTDTSGYVPPEELPQSEYASQPPFPYRGSQPSIVRKVLKTLVDRRKFAFVDLGCGKGRVILLASEFSFREVVGVEISKPLALVARANADIFWKSGKPKRPVRVEIGDAASHALPPGDLVIYLYNPFGKEVMEHVVSRIEDALLEGTRTIYVVYYNPVFSASLDESPVLRRYLAASIPYSVEERGFGPDMEDTVVVWQGGVRLPPVLPSADRKIKITKPGVRAELAALGAA